MNCGVNIGVFLEYFFQGRLIAHINLIGLKILSGDLFNAINGLGRAIAVVINNNDIVACI